jgi:DNA (cytosine-5)-methyltransferase 1
MLYGLDLFSGVGGITLALAPWVTPVMYCECDRYAQSVLLSRMADGHLPTAPIWDDIRTLAPGANTTIDIIYGGFPCQDISVAGAGKGVDGERSGLYKEIVRLTSQIRPQYVFLENVPAITRRGGTTVVGAFAALGYDCRWGVISAASVGAHHKRDRWFMLASDANRTNGGVQSESGGQETPNTGGDGTGQPMAHSNSTGLQEAWPEQQTTRVKQRSDVRNATSQRVQGLRASRVKKPYPHVSKRLFRGASQRPLQTDWTAICYLDRVTDGFPGRVDRIKCLGNAVVPQQVRVMFQHLMGLVP